MRHLQLGDGGAFVHLRVRPQPDAVLRRKRSHGNQIALHRVQVDDQRRRVDVGGRAAQNVRQQMHQVLVSSRGVASASSSRCCVSAQPTSVKPSGVQSRRLIAALPKAQVRGA